MKKLILTAVVAMIGLAPALSMASPKSDLKQFRDYYFKKFPGVPLNEFANGIYGIDKQRRIEWEAMEEFPPYEPAIEIGQELFEKYNVGKCFKNGGIGIRQNYPWFNKKTGKVHTLEGDIRACLKKNGVDFKKAKIGRKKGNIAAISSYMTYTSRGKKLNVVIPNDKRALSIYDEGKQFFYGKRGQLNFSCADCHMYNAGMNARTEVLSPALGHVNSFPVYRKKWQASGKSELAGLGTLHRRYSGCNKNIRARPLDKGKKWKKEQHPKYIALEYFHSYMSNGIPIVGPSIRQ